MIINEKKLENGAFLKLEEYALNEDQAKALARTEGSKERVLIYEEGYSSTRTSPSPSRFLSREYYEHLFNNIKTHEDFEAVDQELDKLHKQNFDLLHRLRPDFEDMSGWDVHCELLRQIEASRKK